MINHAKYPLAIHVFFKKNNQILLSLRANTGYEDGKYSVVAGHVETGESIIEAGIREAKEEAGVDISPYHFKIVGSMHRKSDDERIDYFAVVENWTGEIKNCEENKCGGLRWHPINNLPHNIIPYIKSAIDKTFSGNSNMWYDEYGWNREERRKLNILEKRGIINEHHDLIDVYNHIFHSIHSIDCSFKDCGNRESWMSDLKSSVFSNKILIGTSILQNFASKSNCLLSACTAIKPPVIDGEMDYMELEEMLKSRLEMGMGIDIELSSLSKPDKAINRIDEILFRIDNSLKENNHRPVAAILTLKVSHPRVKEFIKSRTEKDEQRTRLNISIVVDGDIPKGDIEDCITDAINSCDEPGILFSNRIEKENDTPQLKYECTAPCAEVAMAVGEACHFSYLNLAEFVVFENDKYHFDEKEFVHNIKTLVRFLDDIVEYSLKHCQDVGEYHLVKEKRRICVSIAGLATALVKMGIAYNSKEGIAFAKKIAHLLALHTKKASVELAKERGEFPAYKDSLYGNVDWLNEKLEVLEDDKSSLISDILKYGIRNATTLAIPPTGTSSQIAGVSPSIEPYLNFGLYYEEHKFVPIVICDYINKRYSKKEASELYAQLLRNEVNLDKYKEFVSATQIDIETQLLYTKIFQDVSDGSASKTINMPADTTKDDIRKCLRRASEMGLKGVTIYKEKF